MVHNALLLVCITKCKQFFFLNSLDALNKQNPIELTYAKAMQLARNEHDFGGIKGDYSISIPEMLVY